MHSIFVFFLIKNICIYKNISSFVLFYFNSPSYTVPFNFLSSFLFFCIFTLFIFLLLFRPFIYVFPIDMRFLIYKYNSKMKFCGIFPAFYFFSYENICAYIYIFPAVCSFAFKHRKEGI